MSRLGIPSIRCRNQNARSSCTYRSEPADRKGLSLGVSLCADSMAINSHSERATAVITVEGQYAVAKRLEDMPVQKTFVSRATRPALFGQMAGRVVSSR